MQFNPLAPIFALSLRAKMLWLVALVVVLPLLSIDLLMVSLLHESSRQQADHFLSGAAQLFRAQLNGRAQTQRVRVTRLLRDPWLLSALEEGDSESVRLWTRDALAIDSPEDANFLESARLGFDRILVEDPRGEEVLAATGIPDTTTAPLPPPPPSHDAEAVVTRLLIRPTLTLCTSGWIRDGTNVRGVLAVASSLGDEALRDESGRTGGDLALVYQGRILARSSNWIGAANAAEALASLPRLNPEGMQRSVPARSSGTSGGSSRTSPATRPSARRTLGSACTRRTAR